MEQAGVAAAVLPSLFEEQICHDEQRVHALYEFQLVRVGRVVVVLSQSEGLQRRPARVFELARKAAKQSLSIPVIGSLNGSSPGGWVRYAKLIQDAGADAIELNIYFVPTDPQDDGRGCRAAVRRLGGDGARRGEDPGGGEDRLRSSAI